MKEHSVNLLNNFIGGWYLEDLSICDELIDFHKDNPNKSLGSTSNGIDKTIKDSVDTSLTSNDIISSKYVSALQTVLVEYVKKYSYCAHYSSFEIVQAISLQAYPLNGGYHTWHTERTGVTYPETTRHLVFMTYLNDVTDHGETEFFHQDLKIKPEKGLTIIWPADWTFTHRGVPSATQEKMIITGWYNFIPRY